MRDLLLLPRFPRVALACLAAVVLFSACGAEEQPTTEPSPTTTSPSTTSSTLAPTTTTVAPTTTTVAPTTTTVAPAEASEEVAGPDIGVETTWQDLFNTLTAAEQSCINDAVGEELEWVLQQVVLTEDETRLWDAPIYPCLPTPLVEAVFLAGVVYGMELEGLEVGEEQEICLREVIADMDGATLLLAIASQVDAPDESAQMENAAQLLELMAGFLRCLPGFDMGVGEGAFPGEDIYSPGWACPLGTTSDGVEGAARVGLGESVEGVLESVGEAGVFVFGAVEGELYEIEVELGSLSDSILAVCDADGFELAWNDDRPDGGLGSRLYWKASFSGDVYVGVSGYGEGSYTLTVAASDIVDDYSDLIVGAAPLEFGEPVDGVLEYSDDVDYFVFGAVEGELSELEVGLGSLSDSAVAVYGADGVWLDYNDDREDGSLASRLFWRAPFSGDFYVEVSGYGEGSYSLTVAISDIEDDHGDEVEGATRVSLGEAVEGALDYDGDVDYFAFEAVEGELYEIDVALGTLLDSFVGVYDGDWFMLGYNGDAGDGSRGSLLVWRAPANRDYYVEVSGVGEGSYSLTVAPSDIVDDFADGVEGAARVSLGEAVEGALDYDGDVDYFAFEAVEGELYEIDVALGTLNDSVVAVKDEDGVELGWNDDGVDGSLASLVLWRAPDSGDFFVEVSGYGEGSYSMTVAVSDIVDDFADGVEGAARVELGEAVEGALDYGGDVDYFVFAAVEGELYEIAVDLGTLPDSVVGVYDADGFSLDYNDDREDGSLASRLFWRAPDSGDFYVEVSGYGGEGSYVLAVTVSE